MTSATTDRRIGLTADKGYKVPVTAATTANITLEGEQTIDGVAVLAVNAAGYADRVLVKDQTDPIENGIWDVNTGPWTRSLDANTTQDLAKGSQVFVAGGSQYQQIFSVTTSAPINPGVTAINFTNVFIFDSDAINVDQFGAIGDGNSAHAQTNAEAFYSASQALQAIGGGKLTFTPGANYVVGWQIFAGVFGMGYSYQMQKMIEIEGCTNPVIIDGNGAKITVAPGLNYGSFNPVTGAPYDSVGNTNVDYAANLGYVIKLTNNRNVLVRSLEIDGNVNNQVIGGRWGDLGIQINAYSILADTNDQLVLEDLYVHHNALDGFSVDYDGLTTSTLQVYPVTFLNCRSLYNTRQGLSWIGGNFLTATNCDFSYTGQHGAFAYSPPGSGVDIEPENSICSNSTWTNCVFNANSGPGMISDNGGAGTSFNHKFIDCLFIGTIQYSMWAEANDMVFTNCKIVGSFPRGSGTPFGTVFNSCVLSMTATDSPSGTIYGTFIDLGGGSPATFNECIFTADSTHRLITGNGDVNYRNCSMTQVSADAASTSGNWYGDNTVTTNGTITVGANYGQLLLNGVQQPSLPRRLAYELFYANDGASGLAPRRVYYYDLLPAAALSTPIKICDTIFNTAPASSGFYGWVCIGSGVTGRTGSISAASNNLTISSGAGIADGDYVSVAGAGPAGAALLRTVSSGGGTTTLVLSGAAASTTVSGAAITHYGTWSTFGAIT